MVKPEWGIKRTCNGCGAKFYDLRRDPIICPQCDATVDPAAATRTQRTKAPPTVVKEKPVAAIVEVSDADETLEGVGDDVLAIDDDDDDDDAAAIEDVSELGNDDDMLGGIDKASDEGEESR